MKIPMLGALAAMLLTAATQACAKGDPVDGWFTASDGVRLHYLRLGDHGSPVVLFHGFAGDAYGNWFYTGVAQKLAARHRVFALDQRGHGKSDKPHEPAKYGIVRLSLDGVEFLNAEHLRRVHLVGYSMGGSVIQGVMLLDPARVITLTFGGSGSPEVDPDRIKAAADLDRKGDAPGEKEAMSQFLALPGRDSTALLALQTAPPPPPGTPNFEPAQVHVPTLAVVGEFDQPYSKTERMHREMSDFHRVILKGKGHIGAPADPEFAHAVVGFINAHDP